ncbi:unnamed protein product [Thlaspi arvense]|uniref:FBD domain-containing protein n=1 Tax=Thlaspi arvense TaxID=13288 RepID=A0AAU9R9K7_THLAR|nr:unnamed protein product [Thlaspi arvense]
MTCLYLDSLLFEKADVANGKADVANGKADVAFAKFLSGCLVLEELTLMNFGWGYWNSCSVSLTTLKRLTLFCHHMEYMDLNPMNVTFDTPNLVYLSYFDTIAEKYLKVSFNSLIEAHIGLRLTKDQSAHASLTEDGKAKEMVGDATHFLVGICNVLTFSCKAIPEFKNLVQLTIESNPKIGWESLPGLLKNCPKLKTLVMKGLGHKYNKGCGNVCCCNRLENAPSCLSSSPVKVLNIFSTSGHIYDNSEMDIYQIKYFLEKMPCLEQLVVNYNTFYDNAVFESFKKLEKILRIASPKCKIQNDNELCCIT